MNEEQPDDILNWCYAHFSPAIGLGTCGKAEQYGTPCDVALTKIYRME